MLLCRLFCVLAAIFYVGGIEKIAVVGAGAMGGGIAHVLAVGGYRVALVDRSSELVEAALATIRTNMDRQIAKGTLSADTRTQALTRITTHTDLAEGVATADLVVEAITESAEQKEQLFASLDTCAPDHTIFASNTSSISITQLARVTKRPHRVIGMHFMNPVPLMRLVEVVVGHLTDAEVQALIVSLARALDKVPVVVQDYPGFVSNRILLPMINEAICALHESVAGVEAIDTVMRLGMRHPMGPLRLADFIGLDVCLAILQTLCEGFGNPKYAPCPLLVRMVNAARLGVKTREGFYEYGPDAEVLGPSKSFKDL